MNQRTRENGTLTKMKMLMLMPRRTTSREMVRKDQNILSCIGYGNNYQNNESRLILTTSL